MMTIMVSMLVMMLMAIMTSFNPVILSFLLVSMALLLMFLMWILTSSTWMPMIFSLLFLGGILMMFMILSSLMPNEKYPKISVSMVTLSIIVTMYSKSGQSNSFNNFTMMLKFMLESSDTLKFLVMLIASFFFMFMFTVTKNKNPLHSSFCCKNNMIL